MSVGKIIGIVVFSVIVLFIFWLYQTVKTKTTSLNKYAPFKEWVGKTVILNNNMKLFKYKTYNSMEDKNYPYILMDNRHPDWEYLHRLIESDDVEQIIEIPKGTSLKLEKAVQYTNGVSGGSTPVIFGTITSNDVDYNVSYQWGSKDRVRWFDNIPEYWCFHQAPWQEEVDTTFYYLPIAKIW